MFINVNSSEPSTVFPFLLRYLSGIVYLVGCVIAYSRCNINPKGRSIAILQDVGAHRPFEVQTV